MTDNKDWLSGGWMQTYTGRKFYPETPAAHMIDVRDIAHALSNICRFGGHADKFYSVAEHCVRMAQACSRSSHLPKFTLEALLHDATEAYLGDVPTPLKALLPDYKKLELKLDQVIRTKFGLPVDPSPEVKLLDRCILIAELRDVLGPLDPDVNTNLVQLPEPATGKLLGAAHFPNASFWTPRDAEKQFLSTYKFAVRMGPLS
jgi:uncharacterized protein